MINFLRKHMTFSKISGVLNIILVVIILLFMYNKYIEYTTPKEIVPIPMTTEEVKDVKQVQEKINENSNVHINKEQATQIVHEIETIVVEKKVPVEVVTTNGKDYKEESKKYAEEKKADAVIITPSTENDKPIEEIKETDVVNLNQYNIKAYPNNQISFVSYNDGSKEISYEHKIKIFKQDAYIGPAVKVDNGDTAIGLKLTIPF